MKIIKKNQIIIYTLALMLITAGYLNFTNNAGLTQNTSTNMNKTISDSEEISSSTEESFQTNQNNEISEKKDIIEEKNQIADIGDATLVSSNDVVEDYFAKSKLDRDNMYSQMLESYEKILNNANSTEVQKQSITEEIKKINNTKNSIMICENLIRTKGFDNSVVFINGDSVSVIIRTEELKTEEIAQIQNIITRELNVKIENIHISVK